MSSKLQSSVQNVGIPISCIAISRKGRIVIGGGGGPSRSGIKNLLISGKIDHAHKFVKESVYDFGNLQDAPTCLTIHPKKDIAVAGVNGTREQILDGENKSIRVFDIKPKTIIQTSDKQISKEKALDQYLKFTTFDKSGNFLCAGNNDGWFGTFNFPGLKPRFSILKSEKEVLDADISTDSKYIATATKNELKILNSKTGKQVQSISEPHLKSGDAVSFRACRFSKPESSTELLFAAINANSRKNAYIVSWDPVTWKKVSSKMIASSAITCLCISDDGLRLAVGCSNMELIIVDTVSLSIYYKIKSAHTFAITSISFSKDNKYLISGAADETLRITLLPGVWPSKLQQLVNAAIDDRFYLIAILVIIISVILYLIDV